MMIMANINLPISNARKYELAQKFGVNGVITENSWKDAAIQDITGLWRIYDADFWYLYTSIDDKPSPTQEQPSGGGGTGGGTGTGGGQTETPVETTQPVVTWTGKASIPSPIKAGGTYWFGIELKNTGTAAWKGYLGVKIITNDEVVFQYNGDATYRQIVNPNETKMVWCKVTIPNNVKINETTRVSVLRTTL